MPRCLQSGESTISCRIPRTWVLFKSLPMVNRSCCSPTVNPLEDTQRSRSVISADIPAVVQKTPGSEIGFELIDITVAQELAAEFRRSIYEQPLQDSQRTHASTFVMNGETYNVELVLPRTPELEESDEGIVYASFDGGPELAAKIETYV